MRFIKIYLSIQVFSSLGSLTGSIPELSFSLTIRRGTWPRYGWWGRIGWICQGDGVIGAACGNIIHGISPFCSYYKVHIYYCVCGVFDVFIIWWFFISLYLPPSLNIGYYFPPTCYHPLTIYFFNFSPEKLYPLNAYSPIQCRGDIWTFGYIYIYIYMIF